MTKKQIWYDFAMQQIHFKLAVNSLRMMKYSRFDMILLYLIWVFYLAKSYQISIFRHIKELYILKYGSWRISEREWRRLREFSNNISQVRIFFCLTFPVPFSTTTASRNINFTKNCTYTNCTKSIQISVRVSRNLTLIPHDKNSLYSYYYNYMQTNSSMSVCHFAKNIF